MENATLVFLTLDGNLTNSTSTPTIEYISKGVSGSSRFAVYHKVFNVYLQWPVVCIGVIANILTIVIMQTKSFRSFTMSVYFSVLAVIDSLVLLSAGFNASLKETDGIRVFSWSKTCGIFAFFIRCGGGCSSWIIVLIAVERLLVVAFPLKAKIWTSKRKAKITTACTVLVVFLMTSYNFWMVDYTQPKCIYWKPLMHFFKYVKGYYGLFLFGIIPFMIVSVCYASIVVIMSTRKKKRKEIVGRNTVPTNSEKTVERLTGMCLAICLAFLVFYTPAQVYILVGRLKDWIFNPPEGARAVETFLFFMKQLNYATNYFINILSNKQFRRAAVRLFMKRGSQVGPDSQTESAATR